MSMNYVELKVSELREECKLRNLDTSGLKVHLVDRLNTYDKNLMLKSKTENKTINKNLEQNKVDAICEDTVSTLQDKTDSILNSDNAVSENGSSKSIHVEEKALEKVQNKEDRKRPYESNDSDNKDDLHKLVAEETVNWESRTDVHLDFYNSDMNLILSDNGYSGVPLHEDGFQYVCAGVKGNYGVKSGKVYFEVKIVKKLKIELNSDVGESNFIRIGWSADNELLALGEFGLSFGYDSVGKKLNDGNSSDYGVKIDEGDVVGCFLEFNGDSFIIRYTVNGEDQREAFTVLSRELKDHVLMPHIYVKNMSFEINFGQNEREPVFPPKTVFEGSEPIEDVTWTLLGKVNLNQRTRALRPPRVKSECEVLMMCGLPSCGKTTWTEKQIKEHSEKRYNLLSINTVLEKMKVNNLRKKVSASRWDSFILCATQCLNKFMEIAVSRRRNFILDQTNCYPTAQRRRMKPFEEFIRKAIIVVPTDDEYQRRMNQVIQEEGKDVPESAVLQMKENFVIPEENSDLFNEIIFIELERAEAEELIKKYNEEAKIQKKKDSNSDGKAKREADDDNYGKWNSTPKSGDDSEPTAPKKSRWNDQSENRKESKSRDKHERASPERSLPRKNDYKGGFCFSREASDSSKGGNKSSDVGFRSDNKHTDKSKDQRDRSGNRSNNVPYRKSFDNNDRKPKFERDDSKFGNRNLAQGNRDSRPRDRGNEPRGGNHFQGRDRSRGGFNDRRQSGSYEDTESRSSRFPPSNYNDRSSGIGAPKFNNQERGRFAPNNPVERNEFRGRGRGAPGNNTTNMSRDSYVDRRNIPENKDFPNYTEFNPYSENRQSNPPWQQNFTDESSVDRRGAAYGDRPNQSSGGNYDQQYGGIRNAIQGSGVRGKPNDKISNQYNERKPLVNPRGGNLNRGGGRTGASQMDTYSNDDYAYGTNKTFEPSLSKFSNKPPYADPSISQYKESPRPENAYGNAKPIRGGYSKFGDQKSYQSADLKVDSGRDYSNIPQSNSTPYENYQSYDNSQFNQNQGYYNYYTGGDSNKEQPSSVGVASNYQSANPTNRTPYQYQSSNTAPASNYAPSNPSAGVGYQSTYSASNPTSGTSFQTSNYSSNPMPASGGGYQSNYPTSGSGYQSNYPSNPSSAAASYQSTFQSSTTNPTSGTTGTGGYTNPYNAMYDNASSSYNSGYYGGQTTNTFAQSGSYGGDSATSNSKFADYTAKPAVMDRSMPPPPAATTITSQPPTNQNQASWGTGYGEYSQYYGQYYGQ